MRRLRSLSLDEIDPPPAPVRETMDETALAELAQSLVHVGMIEPIIVAPAHDRFEIIAGHRRYLAARIAGLVTVPCVVIDGTATAREAMTVHENVFREDLNPAEEASYYGRLLSLVGGDTDALAALVRRSRAVVEDRLLLLSGDPEIRTALAERRISLGVARELNQVVDAGYRHSLLQAAIDGGASVRLVQSWRARYGALAASTPVAAPASAAAATATEVPPDDGAFVCYYCRARDDIPSMELLYLHRTCRTRLEYVLRARSAGATEPTP